MKSELFSPIQEKIYMTILKNPEIQMSEISRLTKIHRPRLYKEINSLERSGSIIKVVSGKSKNYSVGNPDNMKIRIESSFEEQIANINNIKSLYNQYNTNVSIEIYKGKESIKKAYEILVNAVPKHGTMYRYESLLESQRSKMYIPQIYIDRCREGGDVDRYVITNIETRNRRRPKINRYSRIIANNEFNQNIAQVIGHEHVLFFDYKSETVVLFTGKLFADFQRSIFLSLFATLK
jgi:DNA-binding Lrp family transcriptional regulator